MDATYEQKGIIRSSVERDIKVEETTITAIANSNFKNTCSPKKNKKSRRHKNNVGGWTLKASNAMILKILIFRKSNF